MKAEKDSVTLEIKRWKRRVIEDTGNQRIGYDKNNWDCQAISQIVKRKR